MKIQRAFVFAPIYFPFAPL